MNLEEYISSGVLELYALDLLSTAEKRAVGEMLQKHPELKAELNNIELALEELAIQNKKTPSNRLREKTLLQLSPQETKVVPIKQSSGVSKWLAMAASILLLISLAYNFHQRNKLDEARSTLTDLRSEQSILADQNQTLKTKYKDAEKQVELFQNPDVQNILIKGSDISPESYAYVSFNKANHTVSISGINLPEITDKNSYQLWALVDGNPVDLGIFDTKDSLINLSKTVENPDAFAVTLQDKGGNETPNLDQLYLIGNV